MFPNEEAAKIALKTVLDYKKRSGSGIKVILNVFADKDREIYEGLFSKGQ
jgi:O-acetyl-ADP-ribose deacetylase (regulator of RNase III)